MVHRSYNSKKKALERIKAKRRERSKPLSRHNENVYIIQLEHHEELKQQQQHINNSEEVEVSLKAQNT
ncbi:hypothetical protein RCL_jg24913.t1 [Rhizophagus clarus]|uniref:Uncharacterized protein n=1 Tax=Rhizophagus clarus TaxID=94130 RepID=A0A8H3QS89_9GLOM|nr:hypothetical protein RCL_jg24913.t1 [Rhizophagus clarus]